jgi:hypothetical protein
LQGLGWANSTQCRGVNDAVSQPVVSVLGDTSSLKRALVRMAASVGTWIAEDSAARNGSCDDDLDFVARIGQFGLAGRTRWRSNPEKPGVPDHIHFLKVGNVCQPDRRQEQVIFAATAFFQQHFDFAERGAGLLSSGFMGNADLAGEIYSAGMNHGLAHTRRGVDASNRREMALRFYRKNFAGG